MYEYYRVWRTSGLRFLFLQAADSTSPPSNASTVEASFTQSLPECLRFYWQRVQLPIRLVWTYWELDDDMRGKPDTERLSLWRSIMEAKHWTEKQICFWPLAVRHDGDGTADLRVDVFANLLKTFSPRHVLSFGERSHAALRRHFARFADSLPDGCTVQYLPGAEDMLPDNREAKAQAWRCIKNLNI